MTERTIAHIDMDSFYASVECLYRPEIRNKPVAVGGNEESRHGIVLAKNQYAKKFGITTGEALWQARQKCPNLVTVPANYDLYLKFSKMAKDIYYRYTDMVESYGIDENWADITGSIKLFGSGESIVKDIQKTVYEELGVTVSIGLSFNKIFAKLGSDMNKPHGISIITKENFKNTIWQLPVSDLLYVGRSTNEKLKRFSIKTIGDLANTDPSVLSRLLGKWGIMLNRFANGHDNSVVAGNGAESYIKSVGNSTTTNRDLQTKEDVKAVIYMLSESVAARLRSHGLKCTTVQISVRDKFLISCDRQAKVNLPTFISSEIADKAFEIFLTKYKFNNSLRSIGVRGCNLVPENSSFQLDLFTDHKQREKLERLECMVDDIRGRFGYNALQKGILLTDKKLTGHNVKDTHIIHPVNYFSEGIL